MRSHGVQGLRCLLLALSLPPILPHSTPHPPQDRGLPQGPLPHPQCPTSFQQCWLLVQQLCFLSLSSPVGNRSWEGRGAADLPVLRTQPGRTRGSHRPQPTIGTNRQQGSQFPGRASHSPSAWRRSFGESGAFEESLGNADNAEAWAAPGTERDSSRCPH